MLPAKDAKKMLERLVTEDAIWLFFYLFDHYKVLGLPSGKELTDQQISEAFEAQLLPCYCKLVGLPSNLPLEEIREKVRAMGDLESILQQSMKMQKEDDESKCDRIGLIVISCCILIDPEKRKSYEIWWWLAKWLERLKLINREKEKRDDEYQLMSFGDMRLVAKLYPLIVGGLVITFPVYLPAKICWLIGKTSYKAIQTAILKHSDIVIDDKKAGEYSSGGEDIQDWELVKEDGCC